VLCDAWTVLFLCWVCGSDSNARSQHRFDEHHLACRVSVVPLLVRALSED